MTAPTPTTNLRIEELPAWMRPRRLQVDWGLLIVLSFCLLSSLPLLTRSGLPQHTQAELYEFRSLEIATLVRQGTLFSRWAPDLNYEYGSPLFNYLAPLPHYLSGYHQVLTETGPVESVKLFLALSIFAAGAGMYLFARQRWSSAAGLIGALAYLYSGPLALSLPYYYGDLALLMALGLLPWAAWSLDYLWLHPGKRAFWLALLALSGFLLCDARLACLGGAVLLMVLISGRRLRGVGAHPYPGRYILGVLLAVAGITAFFWLPALVETDQVRWIPSGLATYAGPISLSESLGAVPRFDPRMLNMPDYRGMGTDIWLLALLGIGALLIRRKQLTNDDAFLFLMAGGVLLVFSTPLLYRMWPSPTIFQAFVPYHALLIATFCLAAVGARAATWLDLLGARWRVIALPVLCLIAPLSALPALFPPEWGPPLSETTTLSTLHEELQGYHLATLREGILLPATAPRLPAPLPNLVENLTNNKLDRVNRTTFSAESQIDVVEQKPLYYFYYLNTQEKFNVELYLLQYPGWQVSIGNKEVPVDSSPDGFIMVSVPATNGEMVVWMGGTPARNLGWFISIGSLGLALLVMRFKWPHTEGEAPILPVGRSPWQVIALLVMLAAYAGAAFWLRQNPALIVANSSHPGVSGPSTPLPRFFQGGVDLLGYDLSATSLQPGDDFSLSVFWQAARPILENNQSEAWLVTSDTRQVVIRVPHRHPGAIPTLRWSLGYYVRDQFAMTLPPDLPPGDYLLQIAIGPCTTRDILPCDRIQGMDAFNAVGEAERGAVTIPQAIRVHGS